MPSNATPSLAAVRELLRAAMADPVRAQAELRQIDNMLIELEQRSGELIDPRAGVPRIYRCPNIPVLAPGAVTAPIPMGPKTPGKITSIYGTTIGDGSPAGMSSISVNIMWNGAAVNLVSNGLGASEALFGALFTTASPWFPVRIKLVGSDEDVSAIFRNEGTAPFQPALFYGFEPDAGYAATATR